MKISKPIKKWINDFRTLPKWVKLGIIGTICVYVGVAGITSAAIPWWIGKGDSALHIDYALSVYQGDIPKYHDFVKYPIFHQLDKGYKTQFQRAAANPPLFYIVHAPIVGPLLEAGKWKPAIALGRAFNIFIGVLAVLSLAWAGWLFGGKRRELFAVTVPAVSALSFHFTNLNQNYALDVLLVLLGGLTTVVWWKLLENGFRKSYVASLFVLSILGMSTKASYIIFLAISFLVIMITAFIHGKGTRLKKFINGSVLSGLVMVAVMISIGWFYYYWNYKTSGNWFDAELPTDFKSRPRKSLGDVLTHNGLWSNLYARLTASARLSELITAVSLVGIVIMGARTRFKEIIQNRTLLISMILMVFLMGATFATQVVHSVGVGNFSFRYFLPALFVFGLLVSYGLLEFRKMRGQLVSIVLAAMVVTSVIAIAKLDNIEAWVPSVGMTSNIFEKLQLAFVYNGFPTIFLAVLLLMVVGGLLTIARSLFVLSKPTKG